MGCQEADPGGGASNDASSPTPDRFIVSPASIPSPQKGVTEGPPDGHPQDLPARSVATGGGSRRGATAA